MKLDYTANNFAALDRFGRVVDQIWTDYGAEPDVVLDHYSYTYDRVGNRTSRDNELHAAFDEDYTYDELDRLIASVRADNFDQTWDLDGLGNFSEFDDDGDPQTRTVNEANEIEGITGGWITPTYDAAGNMKSGPRPGNETVRVHYVYDAWNRLVEVREDNSGAPGDLIAEYEYDGLNRRVEKIVDEGASHSHYYYNLAWQMLEEDIVDAQGATVSRNQYVWSPRYVDSPVVRFHDANADGDLFDAGDATRYYTSDANHNVTASIDAASGAVAAYYVYTPYGEATAYDANWSNPAAPAEDGPLYCGYFFDAESSLYQVRNRYYDSSLSAFISRDPIGYEGGINLYRYCVNGPQNMTDPYGNTPNQEGATDPDHLVKRICELEATGEMTADEILNTILDEHGDNTDRYFYTDKYGWVDIRHFAAAAATAHGLGGVGSEITQFLGFLVECQQWCMEGPNSYHSAFSPEDLTSNAAGSHFGEDYVGHTGNSLCDAIKMWMKDSGARPKDDPKSGLNGLPVKDPARGPGGAGSKSSAGGCSTSCCQVPGATPVVGGSQ